MNKSFSKLKNIFYKIPGSSVNDSYNEQLSYDKNGNILSLKRNGKDETEFYTFMIDDLDYDYDGNQLRNVTDTSGALQGFNDGNKHMQTKKNDFEYDDYGNMIVDRNKGITNITYNHLNLPKKITFENNRSIEYLYAADGSKLKKTVTDGATNKTVDYLDGFQYEDEILNFFPHAEGYIKVVAGNISGYSYHYVYNYTDHLGNIRLRYTKHPLTGEIEPLEENHYYPFGLKHQGYNHDHQVFEFDPIEGNVALIDIPQNATDGYTYKFNGMEYQSEMGLDFYDFGARNYDPALGRWMNIDPMAEAMRRHSPYNYAFNNPVFFIDPDGMMPEDWRNSAGNLVYDPNANGGKGDYTEHATQNDKNIGNALQSTATGKQQFNKLVNSAQPTEIIINSGKGPKGEAGKTDNGKPGLYMDMQTGKVDGVEVEKSTITVYMSTIGSLADAEMEGSVGTLNDTSIEGLSFDQIMGAVIGHEIEHIQTDNIILQETGASLEQIEEKPTAVSNKIIQESRDLNKKP